MSSAKIKFEIVTPEKTVFTDEIVSLTVPTMAGEITVLPGHIPLVAIIKPGVITARHDNGETRVLAVSGGFLEVLEGKIVILANTAEMASELDEQRIAVARAKAEEMKKRVVSSDEVAFTEANLLLEKELARGRAVRHWQKMKKIENIS